MLYTCAQDILADRGSLLVRVLSPVDGKEEQRFRAPLQAEDEGPRVRRVRRTPSSNSLRSWTCSACSTWVNLWQAGHLLELKEVLTEDTGLQRRSV